MSTSTYVNSQLSPLVCVSVDLCNVLDRTCPLAVGGHPFDSLLPASPNRDKYPRWQPELPRVGNS